MSNSYTQASNLTRRHRVSDLIQGASDEVSIPGGRTTASELEDLKNIFKKTAFRLETELDRIYESIRELDNAIETAFEAIEGSVQGDLQSVVDDLRAEILWERDGDGNIVPKS